MNMFSPELNLDVKTCQFGLPGCYQFSTNKTNLFIQNVISTETINGWTTFDPIHVFVVDLKVQ